MGMENDFLAIPRHLDNLLEENLLEENLFAEP
jgi:hypothetical protein